MLVKFSVSNFLSFDERTTFSMESGRVAKKKEHLTVLGSLSVLKFAAMYGKNNAGKSNFIKALFTLKTFVMTGLLVHDAPGLWCRIRGENAERPSLFEIEFVFESVRYKYSIGVMLRTGQIVSESLSFFAGAHEKLLYRKADARGPFEFSRQLAGKGGDLKVLARSFGNNGRPFLHSINCVAQGFFEGDESSRLLKCPFRWFAETLEIIYPEQELRETSLLNYEVKLDDFARLLREFDTGITEIRLERVQEEKALETLDIITRQRLAAEMHDVLQRRSVDAGVRYSAVIRNRLNIFLISLAKDAAFSFSVLKFVHRFGGKEVEFPMARESDGTHRLFQLLEILVTDKSKVFVIDEISRCLHPNLTVRFVKEYLAFARKRNVQLVTTTHETRLMSHDIVRRDEIWIADTASDGGTRLYSLEDRQVRIDKVLDENYIKNVWGGVPVFEE